jgi:hypothetical protein
MHENAQKILRKLATRKSAVSLDDLAKVFQAEAKKRLAAKGSSRSAKAVGQQANSLVRNHLRPLVRAGYVKRSARGTYTVTAKGKSALTTKKAAPKKKAKAKAKSRAKPKTKVRATRARAKKKTARKKTARKVAPRNVKAELADIRKQLKQLTGRLDRIMKKV